MNYSKKHLLLLLCALMFFPMFAESTRKERRHIMEGNKLYIQGKYKEAAQQYRMAVALNPESPEGRFDLALAQLRLAAQPDANEKEREAFMKSGTEGMKSIAQLGGNNPSLAAKASYNLGNVAFNSENYQEALQCYKQALRLQPDDDVARRNLRITQKKLQNQNKDKNNDNNQDKDKKDKKDQNKDQNKQNQNQDQNKKDQNKDNQNQKMSNQTAEQILKAMENKENATRARMNAAGKGDKSGQGNRSRKNW